MGNNDSDQKKRNNQRARPNRDARGRWRKGHCPNPKGRPRKKSKEALDRSDMRIFMNTYIEVATSDGTQQMTRREALLNKMYETAMKGRVSMQRYLTERNDRNSEQLAMLRQRYDELLIEWVIDNSKFEGMDGENIPMKVQLEIASLEAVLRYYFPSQYP